MKYEKPEIVGMSGAICRIRGGKGEPIPGDAQPPPDTHTVSAYEADE
jgi:hypothetical protein